MAQKKKQNKKAKSKKVDQQLKKVNQTPFYLRLEYQLAALLFVIAFGYYANTLGHGYALDDNSVIADSRFVRGGKENVGKIFTQRYREGTFGESSTMYRPMSVAMFAVEWELTSEPMEKPTVSHFMNVFLFGLTCMILFLTFVKILGKYSIWLPFIAVLLFAIHPIHTEIVANIKSRDEILVFLFGILALNWAWKYAKEGEKLQYIGLSALMMLFALLSKENAVNFMLIIPLTLWMFSGKKLDWIAPRSLVFLIPFIWYVIIRISVLGEFTPGNGPEHVDNFLMNPDASFIEQKATAMWVMGRYLLLLVFPQPLICDYNFDYIPITNMGDPAVFVSLLVHVGMLGFAVWKMKKMPIVSYAILFYLINMALYSNIVFTIGAGMGERFLYIGSFGFCLGVAYLLTKFLGGGLKPEEKPKDMATFFSGNIALWAILIPIMGLAGYQTFTRNAEWKDSNTLYHADIKKAPESARLNGYLGTEVLRMGKEETDSLKRIEYFKESIEIYSRTIGIMPDYTEAKGQLGLSYYRIGNVPESAKWYEEAIKDENCKGSIYSNYGNLYFEDAQLKRRSGDEQAYAFAMNKAKELFTQSIQREPDYTDGYMNLGSTYGMLGDHANAARYLEQATEYAKVEQLSGIYNNLSLAYTNMGQATRAAEAKRKAQEYARD